MSWMIYGANGYTGRLITEKAAAEGMNPILAGRSSGSIAPLAEKHGFSYRTFALTGDFADQLSDVDLVLHCAGPFSVTAEPMLQACLQARTHYLDITGEIAVFERAQQLSEQARSAGVVLCPGVGFDVIPTDCLAASLKDRMPDATHLALGFDSRSGLSQGTAKTSVEGLPKGGQVRRDGELQRVPLAFKTRTINFGNGDKTAMTIPWGDVATAWYSTGIPNIEAYIAVPPGLPSRLRRMNLIRPLLGLPPVQWLMKAQVERRIHGPNEEQRRLNPTYVWGEVSNGSEVLTGRLRTANGYSVTAEGSIGIVKALLAEKHPGGAYTPSLLVGAGYAETLPGSGSMEFSSEQEQAGP